MDKNLRRHMIDCLLSAAIAFGVFVLGMLGYYGFGVYSQELMSEAATSSGRYEERYEEFRQELELFLFGIGVPEDVVGDDESLRSWYYFELRKRTIAELEEQEGLTADVETSEEEAARTEETEQSAATDAAVQDTGTSLRRRIETPIRDYIAGQGIVLTPEAEMGLENMLSSLEQGLYSDMGHPDLERWHRDKEAFSDNVLICGAAALAVVFASGVGLICIQHYMYRSLHYAGVGVIAGGVVCGIASVVMYIQQMGAHQEGMSSSAEIYVRGVLESGLLSAFCAVGLGILLMIAGSLAGRMRNKQI